MFVPCVVVVCLYRAWWCVGLLQCVGNVRGGVLPFAVCCFRACWCVGVRCDGRTVVVGDHVQAVEQLSLVLVDPFHLDVKHGVGVDLHLVVLLQVGGKLQLVFLRRHEERKIN